MGGCWGLILLGWCGRVGVQRGAKQEVGITRQRLIMEKLNEFISIFEISEDDAIKAILSSITPIPPSSTKQNWSRLSTFGNNSPATSDLWRKMIESDFRCEKCGSQIRITFNHIDGDAKNHDLSNIEVLCFDCNKSISSKKTLNVNHKYKIAMSCLSLFLENGYFPENKEIIKHCGIDKLGSATYMIKFLKSRLNKIKDQ